MEVDVCKCDGKEYAIIKEIEIEGKIFCYFANVDNYNDIMIKKYADDMSIVSVTEKEFEIAIKKFNER